MLLSSLELERARRQLRAFCEQHGGEPDSGCEWRLHQEGNRFEISLDDSAVIRLLYDNEAWSLFVPGSNDTWIAYPPRPQVESFADVMAELEQAPLHVHW